MRISFTIDYKAQWGQTLCLIRLLSENDSESREVCIPMSCENNSVWNVELDVLETPHFCYRYAIMNRDNTLAYEYGVERSLDFFSDKKNLNIGDYWRTSNGESPFKTKAFTDCFFKRNHIQIEQNSRANLILRLNCPQIESDRHIAIVGNQKALGNWDESKKVRLDDANFPFWVVGLDAKTIEFPLAYKYLIVDTATDEVLDWEEGPNRIVEFADNINHTIVTDEHFVRTIPSWRGAGLAIPVFSLRSEKSFGIGDFDDLKLMVDWAAQTGQKIIQTLPINDTILYHTNNDSYPYNAVSVYALHPIYLNLEKLGKLKSKERKSYFAAAKAEFNKKGFSDYQNVLNVKWEYFKEIFEFESENVFASNEYLTFFEKNKTWLIPYAVFSYLRDLYDSPDFNQWPQYKVYHAESIKQLASPDNKHYDQIALYYFLQYHLDKQLSEVHDYARTKGIALKGDIPIGVSPFSVDVWVEPQLFNTNVQAGAPPDDFSVTGQNWGFPTYNWELMAADGYQWWKNRFQKLSEYFDAYRIDHILGFFRIWEIPIDDVWGLKGIFHPALPYSIADLQQQGLNWDENRFLKPYIKDHVLFEIFGQYSEDVIKEFLLADGLQSYKFKSEFDTQKKIEAHFVSLGNNYGNHKDLVCDGLYQLFSEVLFVRDFQSPSMLHPRISMHNTVSFKNLDNNTKNVLDKIYIDYFYHRHNDFWKQQALKKLPALIEATNMLVCGEDLGMVPDSVSEVMETLEILSLEIQRMPKKPNTEFAMPADAPYRSVCTSSTHDMNPIRAWWEEDEVISQRFYNHALQQQGQAPKQCKDWIAELIIEQHLASNAMLVILPWQDWMSLNNKLCIEQPTEERINVPSNPKNFWCYRMNITLEKLLKENELNYKIRGMINKSGR